MIAPVFIWSLVIFLRELPSYILRLTFWDILGIFSYIQVIVLADGLLLTLTVIVIAIILSIKPLQTQFVSSATMMGFLLILFFMPFVLQNSVTPLALYFSKSWFGWAWISIIAAISVFFLFLTARSHRFRQAILKYVDKIAVLSTIYVLTSITGIL